MKQKPINDKFQPTDRVIFVGADGREIPEEVATLMMGASSQEESKAILALWRQGKLELPQEAAPRRWAKRPKID